MTHAPVIDPQSLGGGMVYVRKEGADWVCRDPFGVWLAAFPEHDLAFAAVRQNDMVPADVH